MQVVHEPVIETKAVCSHCGAALTGPYCSQCGQKVRKRLTLNVVAAWIGGAFSLEKGAIYTTVELIKRSGAVIREYLNGHVQPYSNPVRYYLMMLTIWQLVALWTGGVGDFSAGFAQGFESGGSAEEVAEFLSTYFVVGLAGLVVFWTILSRLVFRKSGLNLAEQSVFYLYLFGLFAFYQSVVYGLIAVITPFFKLAGYVFTSIFLLVWLIQVIQAAHVHFKSTWWHTVMGSLVVVGVGFFVYVFLILIGVVAVTRM